MMYTLPICHVKKKNPHKNNLCVAFLTLYSPCRRNLDHHLGSLQSDLGSIGLLVLNLRSIDNHLTGHRNTLLLAILTFPAISFHYCDLSSEKKGCAGALLSCFAIFFLFSTKFFLFKLLHHFPLYICSSLNFSTGLSLKSW